MNWVLPKLYQFCSEETPDNAPSIILLLVSSVSPLDKSLILRLKRAQQLCTLLSNDSMYTHKFSKESLSELAQTINQIDVTNQQCDQLMDRFKQLAAARQMLFQHASQSLKGLSDAVLDAVGKQHGVKSTPYQLTKLVLHKIRAQNALPAPDDLYSPTIEKELHLYDRSYKALGEHFSLLISTLTLFEYQPTDSSLTRENLLISLNHFEVSSQETKRTQAEILHAYERRSELFRHLKWRIESILQRVRHLYGSTNPVYVAAKKSKI